MSSRNLTELDLAIDHALMCTVRADDVEFERLPVPVRYRASGAIRAWEDVRHTAGRYASKLSVRLDDIGYAPLELYNDLADFLDANYSREMRTPAGRVIAAHGSNSIFCQAFWQRQGALYEPTPALHKLLALTDVSGDVPLEKLRLPASALCILPDPSMRDLPDGVQAIMVFEHAGPEQDTSQRWLTIAAWPRALRSDSSLRMEWLRMRADGDCSLEEGLAEATKQPAMLNEREMVDDSVEETKLRWRKTLEYMVKMLLYLSLEQTQVIQERPYSIAPRIFAGLGKRKRAQRLGQIDQLYDRYIVGPATHSDELHENRGQGDGRDVRTHWRRGHFRMQPHGPAASQRKPIFIMPTIVHADRLGIGEGERSEM